MTTEILGLDEISVSQASKHATHNLALRQIEARSVRVLSRTTSAQPGSPSSGDAYILPVGSTGTNWLGNDGDIANYTNGIWYFYTPVEGVTVDVVDEGTKVRHDGSNWVSDTVNPLLSKDVAGGVDVTLTSSEASNDIIELSGALTANINIVVSDNTKILAVYNNTSGAFTLTVKTSAGTGISVGQGMRAMLYCDGVNVVRLASDV